MIKCTHELFHSTGPQKIAVLDTLSNWFYHFLLLLLKTDQFSFFIERSFSFFKTFFLLNLGRNLYLFSLVNNCFKELMLFYTISLKDLRNEPYLTIRISTESNVYFSNRGCLNIFNYKLCKRRNQILYTLFIEGKTLNIKIIFDMSLR
jgi:hypothetical protein